MKNMAAVAFGANLEDPPEQLRKAREFLASIPGFEQTKASGIYLTEPVGGPSGQNWYHNQAVLYQTTLGPLDLLAFLMDVEKRLGRIREVRWGPRVIDLDLLFLDQEIMEVPELSLPHPRLAERAFVLEPLNEIAPNWVHPVTKLTVSQMLAKLLPGPSIRRLTVQ
ncbi:MAG: 2-amino-4-hydroxy-6-hydroxymethyldihydropteridine diphosphokinase [Deltaproteobacteria bacterium]|jgi:2-amino-4-hydroxy-6-hydroxymethyldihydropteridine diphosphokinase|nr:2-amino-4-hydroxy-6-hydroxymethyldihydropteridine diphosphokinase [Deltaproteobacteria bacterium]